MDIANELGITKPTVCDKIKWLQERDYLYFGMGKCIYLTNTGKLAAEGIYKRRVLIKSFLHKIGVSEENVKRDAAAIGNSIGDETLECLEKLYKSDLFTAYAMHV